LPLNISFALPAAAIFFLLAGCHRTSENGAKETSAETSGYADAAQCATCHASIAKTYKLTGMGRSFHKVQAHEFALLKTFEHAASMTEFAMIERDGAYYQRRWQKGFDGKETNVDEKSVDYVLGSGNHARTYLHKTERGVLQELPLGWYAEKGGYWAMNPGYDRADYAGSVRPIYYECMFCHNGYPKTPPKDASESMYLEPLPEGIDCQRCHGPGQKHIDTVKSGGKLDQIRAAIVNPARLSPEREMEVCMQCHLETSNQKLPHAVRRFGREPFSYRPGQPLGDFALMFDRAPGKNQSFEVAQGAYRFRESQCFLKSAGNLRCTTCHNPHDIPRGAPAAEHYNQVCLGCHQQKLPASSVHKADANCVSCHMPKRRTDDGVHIVMTDHRIAKRPPAGDLLADKPERAESAATSYKGEVVLYYPAKVDSTAINDLTVAVAQVREQSNLKEGISRFAALLDKYKPQTAAYYTELAQAYQADGNAAAAVRYFSDAAQRDPNSPLRHLEWGDALMDARDWPQAEARLRRGIELAPTDPRGWGRLGWVLWQQNKAPEAIAALKKAIELDPEIADVRNNLALVYWGTGEAALAEQEFREALRIQPGVAEWRLNLGRALATRNNFPEARFQMEESLRLKPDYAEARVDYARALADSNLPAEAVKQATRAVRDDPSSSPGHELLGALLAAGNNMPGARKELEESVRLKPDFWRARFELGMVLLKQGDRSGFAHLNAVAQGADPETRAAAQQVLRESSKR
jgi:predicted CXXCH cytochrome family protein